LTVAPFELPERVDFENMVAVRSAGERHIEDVTEPSFDLSGLKESNSVAVAVLVAWFRYAHARGKVVEFTHAPAELMNIIEVTELSDVLPVEGQ
jgi:ABC-type transporter Mla MlaB component